MDKQSKQQGQSASFWLEAMRLERTSLSQDELAFRCGIPRATYQRWISGKTEVRLTIPQLKALCNELGIERVEEIPENMRASE